MHADGSNLLLATDTDKGVRIHKKGKEGVNIGILEGGAQKRPFSHFEPRNFYGP